jgi:hypothetical protein
VIETVWTGVIASVRGVVFSMIIMLVEGAPPHVLRNSPRRAVMVWRRLLAGFAIVLAVVVLFLSLGAGIGVWVAKGPASARARDVFGRVDVALGVAEQGLDQADASLTRAADRLNRAREEQQRLAREPARGNAVKGFLARTVQQQIAPDLGNTHEKLHTVAEASVVVNTVLDDFADFPLLSLAGVDSDHLTELNTHLADVAPAAWELSRLLGNPGPEPESEDDGRQLSRVEQTVTTVRGYVNDYRGRVKEVRDRTGRIKARAFALLTPAVTAISFLCFWIALSQVVVLGRARAWWRGAGRAGAGGEHDRV